MRIWSLQPSYLDAKGLVALWREALLARAVLLGHTRGYTHHPQVIRFRSSPDPVAAIENYLVVVYEEALQRGYAFDRGKLGAPVLCPRIEVTRGQLRYEMFHLKGKLQIRDPQRFELVKEIVDPIPHPLFLVVEGEVEPWEKVTP